MNSSLKNHWVAILVVTLITFTASVVLTITQPMEYRSGFTILVLDKDQNIDGYAAAKSAERLSQSLAQSIGTAAFADQVYAQVKDQVNLKDNPIISSDPSVRREEWKKRVVAQAYPDVGQVKVAVYQRDRSQAETLANALSIATVGLGGEYLGGSKNVELKIVDSTLTSKSPVRPNVFMNLAVGLILGLGGSVAFITLFGAAGQTSSTGPMLIMAPTMLSTTPQPTHPDHNHHKNNQSVAMDHELHIPSASPHNTQPPEHGNHRGNKNDSPDNLPISDEWQMP